MATAILNRLNVVVLKKAEKASPVEQRRLKLISKLEEQAQLAKCQIEGKKFSVLKNAWTRDDAGNKTRVQREKNLRPWWFPNGAGITMTCKYGSRDLEIQKGKKALSLGDIPAVLEVVPVLIEAVRAGELDQSIEQAIAAGKSKKARS